MSHVHTNGQAVEIIRFVVPAASAATFVGERAGVEAFVRTLPGHVGTEILRVGNETYVMLVRWADEAHAREAQRRTEAAPEITSWLERSGARFVSFETSDVVYAYPGE